MSELPPPDRTHDLPTSFGTVRAYEWSGPADAPETAILLVPGRSSGAPMWSANLPGFLATHRVFAFDALGDAGLSVQNTPFTHFDDQAQWIAEAVVALTSGRVHVVGHSFGGATAVTYARVHPERVASLVALEPVFTFAWPPPWVFFWTTVGALPFVSRSLREKALGRIGGEDFASAREDPTAQMIAAGTEHFVAALPTPRLLSDVTATPLSMPVYVAIAARDSLAGGDRAAARARRLLPDATVTVWPDTTHSLPMQVPEALGAALRAFWKA